MKLSSDTGVTGNALRVDFGFSGGGYAVSRRTLDLDLPENYAFRFRLRGVAPPNHIEFKLVDSSGENVWWHVRRNHSFTGEWEEFTIKKRHIQFAWGPQGGGEIRHVAALEIVITAGSGGQGTVWIDDLEIETLPPPGAPLPSPEVNASSTSGSATGAGATPSAILDALPTTFWAPAPQDPSPWIEIDFGQSREFGGLTVRWIEGRRPPTYSVEFASRPGEWRLVREVGISVRPADPLYLPESDTRFVRLRLPTPRSEPETAPALAEVRIEPLSWSTTREAFFQALAAGAPRGAYPRGFAGEQAYWTVVGIDGDRQESLFGEDGAIEAGAGLFSVEPFLIEEDAIADDRSEGGARRAIRSWADASSEQSLEEGSLPIPSVHWPARTAEPQPMDAPSLDGRSFDLTITPVPHGAPGASAIAVRYRVENKGNQRATGSLALAVRPFQVNPPSQSLNILGGTARVDGLSLEGNLIQVDTGDDADTGARRSIVCLMPPDRFRAATFDGGDIIGDFLLRGKIPTAETVSDPFGAASGLIEYNLDLDPGATSEIVIDIPLYSGPGAGAPDVPEETDASSWFQALLEASRQEWAARSARITIDLPPSAGPLVETLRAQIGYILVNRAGPGIQPGTRSYARSWIRDGALTSSALLRVGLQEPVREFIEWFAPHQYENGKIPCVVDTRGADPVPEHDSSGEFIFLVAEYFRYTGDRDFAQRFWPAVRSAARYLDALRQERRTEEYLWEGNRHFYGLLPPSISHEGYSAKPMHSYWDDLWALRGFRDAVMLAALCGTVEEQAAFVQVRDEFTRDFVASVEAAMRHHEIDYMPGCADLGDFDATSTTMALSPVHALDVLPRAAVERTFERYWEFFTGRAQGEPWDAYTPYELRNVGAFVHLGWKERAHEALAYFFAHQKPPGWRQWPEVIWSEPRKPRFLGDLPHTWVGSDYVRSFLDMLAYTRDEDRSLVLGAGVLPEWVAPGSSDVTVALPTPYGQLRYRMRGSEDSVTMEVDAGLTVPNGGIVIQSPRGAFEEAMVNGERIGGARGQSEVVLRVLPAVVVMTGSSGS